MVAFDSAPERPVNIDNILNGLDRYNPETTGVFQEYVAQQCENQTYDAYANLALLKLYQFNPHLSSDATVTSILAKALTVFPSPDFSACLHLLPPSVLILNPTAQRGPGSTLANLADTVQKLSLLNNLLSAADYSAFWSTLNGDDAYEDLTADVAGFEELIRVRIAGAVSQAIREVDRATLEKWLDLKGAEFDQFVGEVCDGWAIDGNKVTVPINKENEAKGLVVRENVKFDQFGRVVRRAFEESTPMVA